MLATLTSKGQLTLPKEIRDRLGLRPGDQLDFTVLSNGQLLGRRVNRDLLSLVGLLHRPGQAPVSVEEMNDAIGEHLTEKHDRALHTGGSADPKTS